MAALKYARGGGEIKVEDDGSIKVEGTGHVQSRCWFLPSKHACWTHLTGAGHCKTFTQVHFPKVQDLFPILTEVLFTSRLKGKLK